MGMAALYCDTNTSYSSIININDSTTTSTTYYDNQRTVYTRTYVEYSDEEIQKAILATLARLKELSTWQVPYRIIPQKKLYTSKRISTTHKLGRSRNWTGKNFCKCSH